MTITPCTCEALNLSLINNNNNFLLRVPLTLLVIVESELANVSVRFAATFALQDCTCFCKTSSPIAVGNTFLTYFFGQTSLPENFPSYVPRSYLNP